MECQTRVNDRFTNEATDTIFTLNVNVCALSTTSIIYTQTFLF